MTKLSVRRNSGDQKNPANATEEMQKSNAAMIAELRAVRKAQQEAIRRTAELKLRLLQLTESHWDQSISILKRWVRQ